MKRTTFKICFYIQKSRIAKDGQVPILLRVTINGLRSVVSVNLKVNPDNWNAVAGRSIANTRMDEELNTRLNTIRLRVMQIYREMEMDKVEITARDIIDKYLGRDTKPKIMLLDVFREHNDRCRKLADAGKDIAAATVVRYETTLKHVANFIKHTYGMDDIPLADVNHKYITDLDFYLKTERGCSHNSSTKYLKNFKKIIRIALANDLIQKDPFANIKFRLDVVEPEFLEDHEIQAIVDKEIRAARMAQVKDAFLFCCFTGLAFSDVKGLKPEHIVRDNDGSLWIRKPRQKTKIMCNIPLLDVPKQIIEKYKDHPSCVKQGQLLPVPCNQKMNAYLKELADLCGINKEISTHTGRHSFATSIALANGVSIENVAKMLGHSDTKMTRHYARVLDKSIKKDMDEVQKALSSFSIAK
ncbi:MAG: site-specific integrase [Rikenellaceae bacterium]|nr:site-specific integrase [Rikenellaceae bacterium]